MALTDNLVSYWKLDGNSNDSVGSNNGSDTNITYGTSYGKINQGALFNGTSSKILTNYQPTYADTTIAGWIKTTMTGRGQFFGNTPHSGTDFLVMEIGQSTAGKIYFYWQSASGVYKMLATTGTVNDGNWQFLTFTRTSTTLKIYLNGSETTVDTTGAGTIGDLVAEDGFAIGARNDGGGGTPRFFFNGSIDEVGIWSRALSSDEVSTLYNSGNGLTYPFTTTSIKSINGLANASIKSVNGLARASVKKINGLA